MKLIFVYNADRGKLNALISIAHKIIQPKTYQCSLCAITHYALSEKKAWIEFKASTKHDLEFLHKDEFEEHYKHVFDYPVVLENSGSGSIKTVLNSKELREIKTVEELINRLEP